MHSKMVQLYCHSCGDCFEEYHVVHKGLLYVKMCRVAEEKKSYYDLPELISVDEINEIDKLMCIS